MVLPNLLHPVPVIIEKIDRGSTVYDEDTREPIQQAARSTSVTVQGQIKWGSDQNLTQTKSGPRETSAGYVLFRRVDLAAKSVTLEVNDRFAKLGNVDTDVYISRLEWMGHYSDQGGPSLVKAFFTDRRPGKQTKG